MALGLTLLAAPALAQDAAPPMALMPGMDHSAMPGMDHSNMPGMDHGTMRGMTMNSPEVGMAGISGARGFYPFERDTSGTAWQPDASPRIGVRLPRGQWLFMVSTLMQAGYARVDGFQKLPHRISKAPLLLGASVGVERHTLHHLVLRIGVAHFPVVPVDFLYFRHH